MAALSFVPFLCLTEGANKASNCYICNSLTGVNAFDAT